MQTGAAYVRVSTEDQLEFSPDSQIRKIREYAETQEIYLPEENIFLDEGISGRSAKKRPAFMEMIKAAKQKPRPFDVILVWKFSRFARNRQDSILYKSMLRKECGIDVVSITEQLSGDPTAILIEALLEAMDEYYSVNLAQEVKRGMNEKFSRGGVVSIPPFGYKMGKEHFEIDEVNAPYVRMIYQAFLSGASLRQIAVDLNHMGVRTIHGNPFENRSVEYILSNPTYLGKLRRKTEDLSGDRYYQSSNIRIVQGEHEAIIDEASYEQVQNRIKRMKRVCKMQGRSKGSDFMLHGLVRCSHCQGTLIRTKQGRSLQCHRYAKGQCSHSHSINLQKINEVVLDQLETDMENMQCTIHINKEPLYMDMTQHLLVSVQKRLKRIETAYQDGIDTLEEYRKKKEEACREIQELKIRTARLDNDKSVEEEWRGKIKATIPLLRSEEISEADKNEFLRSFVSKIIFSREDDTIQIYYDS